MGFNSLDSNNYKEYEEKNEKKLKIAKAISTITNPPIICIPLFLIISLSLTTSGMPFSSDFKFDLYQFALVEGISLIFTSVLPLTIILYWAKKLNTDKDISNREDRFTPLIVGALSYFIGFAVSLILKVNPFLTVLLLCYSINTFIVTLITTKWKISIHTTGLSGPVTALIILLGSIGALFGLMYPVLIWSRVILKKHTMAQAIVGGVQGFFLTALELYLFYYLFKIPTSNLQPLNNVIWTIFALIGTPIVLGILSYLNDNGLKDEYGRRIFHFLGFAAFGFFTLFAPKDALITLCLAGPIAILITCYGNYNFSWFRAIKIEKENPNERLYILLSLISSILWLISSMIFLDKITIAIASFVIATTYGIAEPIGEKIGKHELKLKHHKYLKRNKINKTIESPISIFAFSIIILIICSKNIILSIFISAIITLIELISPKYFNNLLIPLITAILLKIFL